MNKITVIVFLLFNIITLNSQVIKGKITYVASAKKALNYIEKKETKKTKKETKKAVNKLYKNAKDVKVILKFNNLISEYSKEKRMNLKSKDDFNYTDIMSGGSNKYYTHNSNTGYSSNTFDCELLGECFLIENLLPKWELTQDSKIIQGFKCYKAILRNPRTGKKNIEAWYAPKIPYSYGIMNYYGLPGVILEINRNTLTITAVKIELNPINKIIIKEPKKIKKLSRKEFDVLKRKSFSEFYKKN